MFANTKGLVVKEVNVGERDKILTILTADLGKISASAPGARVLKSKKLASAQLLSYSDFAITQSKGRYCITQASIIESFYELRLSIEKTALAFYIAELCSFVSSAEDECAKILSLALNTLYLLAKKDRPIALVKAVFELRLMAFLGFMPDLVCCHVCGEFENGIYLCVDEGKIVCSKCLSSSHSKIKLQAPAPVLNAMRHIIYSESDNIFSFEISDRALKQLAICAESYVTNQIDATLPTLEFYKSLT